MMQTVQTIASSVSGQGASSATGPNRGASAAGMGDPGERASSPNYELEDGQHFVDKHQVSLIDRVTLVEPILDRFLDGNFISREAYKNIEVLKTSCAQMRKLLHDVVFPGGKVFKDELCKILENQQPYLMKELKEK
ncbi:hypothetical protein JZ751_011322 [Albula glossodonta]|uniref:CARD domain-containing protein n=1 Tax=Albula glossodonta TaxID=121402 RepID=A0A8T2MZJ4_9TELE|nr:hypothetical protein JZ751_011322 [Albula glossodonta]